MDMIKMEDENGVGAKYTHGAFWRNGPQGSEHDVRMGSNPADVGEKLDKHGLATSQGQDDR